MKQKIKELNKENLQNIMLKTIDLLSKEQCEKLETMIEACTSEKKETKKIQLTERMSQEFVDEKMQLLKKWMDQIDEGELYLDIDEYEDYSDSYWDRDWITEYYDNQGIGEKIEFIIRFAQDLVDDQKYQEANEIYEWLWEMSVSTDPEYESDPVNLEALSDSKIIHTDLEQLALLALYADYQVQEPENRAADIYLYFSMYTFQKLHIQDMFCAGREELEGAEQFWNDWIALLQTRSGEVESRLLQEAVLYREGIDGVVKMADKTCEIHPSLYLSAMQEYNKKHDYLYLEKIGEQALDKIDSKLKIRSKTALMAAYASSCLGHNQKQMQFCWEGFRSDSTARNFLRLFGTEEMAAKYGLRGQEVLCSREKGNPAEYVRNKELEKNIIGDYGYYTLCFYTGDIQKVKNASKNPQGSLGWTGNFIPYGIRLILLYLYEKPLPSKAAAGIAEYIGFLDEKDVSLQMDFERKIVEESRRLKVSTFWNYFQRWKKYYQMSEKEKKTYFAWAEKIVYSRTDAIVSNQHRRHYGEVAELLAMVGEIKEDMDEPGAKQRIYQEYKRKFPRHSSFQAEMKSYFGA
ncbi:MAG: hypothetical protein PUI46_05490 [Lachnospiraceae bacterium]|nr:hypothetical protein [Lachnospiraceae bacterium]MDY5700097.1 hypothetical protein [Lachnospiraceae bacterium]